MVASLRVPAGEFRSTSRGMVSPGAMLVAAVAESLVGPTARTTLPELIAWGAAEVVSVKVAKAPPRIAPVPATTTATVKTTRLTGGAPGVFRGLAVFHDLVLLEAVGGDPLCFSLIWVGDVSDDPCT
jgi:hypothetical protein